jgi:predicted helicase
MPPSPIKPTHKAIKTYYEALQAYARQDVDNESAVRSAFQNLLDETGRHFGWTLIPELGGTAEGRTVRPDGTFRDDYYMTRGYWEAKDSKDHLEVEIKRKIAKGYPLGNIIFEDTRQAHLYQNGELAMKADMTQAQSLADLLNAFYAYIEPAHEDFDKAIGEFQERVPDLARGLVDKINDAHQNNPRFIAAFDAFYELCRNSLNPHLRREAVDEMLVQHLLTERLIRTIFDNPDFTRRNVIAAEVEKVIDALVSKSFARHEFLKSLDRFYLAIESAAATIASFPEKQHFLNSVYERFFQGYSVEVADTHGIVYTPQEIVDFMCASVAEVLHDEFGKTLGDEGVNILDPCTGTGNFIVNILRRIPKKDLPRMYREQLFANEVMLLPYYIAALNIEHAYYEQTGVYEPFEGLCFVDTLDLAKGKQGTFGFMTQENVARVEREKTAQITVVIGNPPYNAWQLNENDNNKNRKYEIIDRRVSETYAKDSKASNKNALSDMYVKFFRWAVDRLNGRDGIVAFVTNNSFVDQIAFDGVREHFTRDFTRLYHLHLEGNVRQNPKLSGTAYNVFGIQVGVGITIAVRCERHRQDRLLFHRVEKMLRRQQKLAWLAGHRDVKGVKWQRLKPDDRHTWLVPENGEQFAAFLPMGTKESKAIRNGSAETIFATYSGGVKTNRDDVVYDFHRRALVERVGAFIDAYNSEVDRYKRRRGSVDIDEFVRYDRIKWSESLKANVTRGRYAEYDASQVRTSLYRPFTKRQLYFNDVLTERRYQFPQFFPVASTEQENRVIAVSDIAYRADTYSALVANSLVDLHLCASLDGHQCFPFYVYDEDGTNRRENITDWALKHFREHYRNKRITKWDIFYYVYGVLHHPGYRERFAENLKRELPRIPLAADFRAFSAAGQKLARLHLDYEKLEPWKLEWIETPGVPLSYRVDDKMRLTKDKTALKVNESLTLAGIPPEAFRYRLGNRSALNWVIDQYQVSQDKRSGIRSDPNRPDNPEYIVRLVGQAVRVSIETMKIVDALPAEVVGSTQ